MTRSIRLFALVTLLIVAACGGGSDPGTDPGAVDVGSDPGPADVIADVSVDIVTDRLAPDVDESDPGALDPGLLDPGTVDPGVMDVPVQDPGPTDPGVSDPGAADVPAVGTKGAGELCKDASECAMSMDCIAGQYTPAHCNIQCTTTDQCLAIAPGTTVTCQAIGGTGVCLWTCSGGKKCPGQLPCSDGYFCG